MTQTGERVKIVGEYTDDGISGDKAEGRPGFQRLLADAKNRTFDGITVYDLNRLGRLDPMEFGFWLLPVRQAGVRLFSLDRGERDWHDALQLAMLGIETTGSKEYLKKLSAGVLRGRRQTAESGHWTGGVAPVGYMSVPDESVPPRRDGTRPKRLVIDPEWAGVVTEVFERYARTEVSMLALARDLNARKVPPRLAKLKGGARNWSRAGVRWLLTNPVYLGRIVFNRFSLSKYNSIYGGVITGKQCLTENPKREAHPESDYVVREGTHDALVDPETWSLVQQRIASRKGTNKRGGAVGEAMNTHGTRATIFAGLVYCSVCGSKMHGYRAKWGAREMLYACEGRRNVSGNGCRIFRTIPETHLVEAATAFVLNHLGEHNRAEWTADAERRLLAVARSDPARLDKARAEVAALDAKIDSGEDAFLTAPPSLRGGLAAKLEAWKAQRDAARERVKEQEARAAQTADVKKTARAVADALAGLHDALTTGDDAKRRAVFRLCCERIEVTFGEREYRGGKYSKPAGCLILIREDAFTVGNLVGPVCALLGLNLGKESLSRWLCPS